MSAGHSKTGSTPASVQAQRVAEEVPSSEGRDAAMGRGQSRMYQGKPGASPTCSRLWVELPCFSCPASVKEGGWSGNSQLSDHFTQLRTPLSHTALGSTAQCFTKRAEGSE